MTTAVAPLLVIGYLANLSMPVFERPTMASHTESATDMITTMAASRRSSIIVTSDTGTRQIEGRITNGQQPPRSNDVRKSVIQRHPDRLRETDGLSVRGRRRKKELPLLAMVADTCGGLRA